MIDNRVFETSTTTGTGTLDLAGVVSGYQTFVATIGTGNTCYYTIANRADPTEWEIGVGTVTDASPDTLSRDTVIASSNGGALVSFSAGTKSVFCDLPAGKRVYQDASGNAHLLGDNYRLYFGAGNDASIRYNGSDLMIDPREAGSGNVRVLRNLQLDNGDNKAISFGGDNDASIYYDGSNLIVSPADVGTGNVYIDNGGIILENTERLFSKNASGTSMPIFFVNGSNHVIIGDSGGLGSNVYLYQNGAAVVGITDAAVSVEKPLQHNDGYFCAYDNAGGTTIGTSWSAVTWDTQTRYDTDSYTHSTVSSSEEITIDVAGDYLITYDITTDTASGVTREHSDFKLQTDTGGGYADVGGTYRSIYNRISADGRGSCSCTIIVTAAAGDKFKVVGLSDHATDVTTVADGSAITIRRV